MAAMGVPGLFMPHGLGHQIGLDVPLIDRGQSGGKFKDFINYSKLKPYRNFGGIRIEDNYLITEEGNRMLGKKIPKTVKEVEAVRRD
jgi:Xaa-Pro aminopeptidase